MMTQNPVPIIVSEVPILAGDVMRQVKTPVVSPPLNTMSRPTNAPIASPEATTVANALATRRLSAGALIAESIGIDLNAIGRAEAKKIMSVEHKVLGFRPPHGSLAAEAQAAAAKHPQVTGMQSPDPEKLKEAAKIDAERILAERTKNEKEGNGSPVKTTAVDAAELAVDLDNITAEDARKLMSHEHRALGFRPPPGSLAAEAQAAAAKHSENTTIAKSTDKPRRNSNEPNARKPRQNSTSTIVGSNGKQRRGSSESSAKDWRTSGETKRRGSNDSQKSRRGSNEITRTSSDQTSVKTTANDSGRRASSITGPSTVTKEELLREAALRDAERIKATRGINGTTVTEQAHVEVKDIATNERVAETINLPAPVQGNVDLEAKEEVGQGEAAAVRATDTILGRDGQGVAVDDVTETEVAPGELEHEDATTPAMSRSETTDSVQIVGDVFA